MTIPTGIPQHGKLSKEECGCAYDELRRWIRLCKEHKEQADEVHAAAMAHVSVSSQELPEELPDWLR